MGSEVALASLGIVASITAALIWLLKKQFSQNDTTLKLNTVAVDNLNKTLDSLNKSIREQDKAELEFRKTVMRYLKDIDGKADRNYQYAQEVTQQTVLHQTVVSSNKEG